MPLTNLEFCERKVYSQNGEDGILDALWSAPQKLVQLLC